MARISCISWWGVRLWVTAAVIVLTLLCARGGAAESGTLRFSVVEEKEAGVTVGKVQLDEFGIGENGGLRPSRIKVLSSTKGLLAFNVTTGGIFTTQRLDRERQCKKLDPCVLRLDLLLGERFLEIEVQVIDVNDHSPEFGSPIITLNISESVHVGARFPLVGAHDPDAGMNGIQRYSLSSSDTFTLHVRAGFGSGLGLPELIVAKPLDRERISRLVLMLHAVDGGSPARSGSLRIVVHVLDSNDNRPVCTEPVYRVNVQENGPRGQVLVHLNATDMDSGHNGMVHFYLDQYGNSERTHDLFTVDRNSGQIRLRGVLDYEESQSLEFSVRAEDQGAHPLWTHCKVLVHVLDQNDNAPEFTVHGEVAGTLTIDEGETTGAFVTSVQVRDRDSGSNGKVSASLRGNGPFTLHHNGDVYSMYTTGPLDRERRSQYNVTLVAWDTGEPRLETLKTLKIVVGDVNDNAPRFQSPFYEFKVRENNVPGALIASVAAFDPDQGDNGTVFYSIVKTSVNGIPIHSLLSINGGRGNVYALLSLDYEQTRRLSFQVQARDHGFPQRNSTVQVTIFVEDQNDNAPSIVSPRLLDGNATLYLLWGTSAGSSVIRVEAKDKDHQEKARLSYATIRGNDHHWFSVNEVTGEIRTTRRFQKGDRAEHILEVLVSDQGSPPLSTRATLRILLVDVIPEAAEQEGEAPSPQVPLVLLIALGGICSVLFVAMVVIAVVCKRENKEIRTYNCRTAETYYRKPCMKVGKQKLSKTDIVVMPSDAPRKTSRLSSVNMEMNAGPTPRECDPRQSPPDDSSPIFTTGSGPERVNPPVNGLLTPPAPGLPAVSGKVGGSIPTPMYQWNMLTSQFATWVDYSAHKSAEADFRFSKEKFFFSDFFQKFPSPVARQRWRP
uniref:Protocadherin beta-1 n=1 Tax=Eptatretus burgeri TaxID=7764 RepID=A0A8C4R7E0_EPTBU